ncbi:MULTISPECIES: hypothetical protein [Aeromonas]|uniref:hypothetical protein n=1 Tax=Aeromonas TaxID=642 RepID=UPI0035293214
MQRAQGDEKFADLYIKGAGEAHTGVGRQESIETPHFFPLNVGRLLAISVSLPEGFRPLWLVWCSAQKKEPMLQGTSALQLAAYFAFVAPS